MQTNGGPPKDCATQCMPQDGLSAEEKEDMYHSHDFAAFLKTVILRYRPLFFL